LIGLDVVSELVLNCFSLLIIYYLCLRTSKVLSSEEFDRVISYDVIDTILGQKSIISILRTCLIFNFK